MPVGEVFLGAFLQVAFDRLASQRLLKFAREWGIDADLKRMKKVMSKLLALISDAEANQIKNELVRMWLDELKDVVYDADDILDLFETEFQRCKLNQSNSSSDTDSTTNQVWDRLTSSINSIKDSFSLNVEIKYKIKEITGRLEDIAKEKNDLGLIEGTRGTLAGGISIGTVEPRLPTSSLVNEPHIYGRDRDVEKMIQFLLSEEACEDNVGVIPIVGPGGIGKSTFAQVLYNHARVEEHFDLRAWVCVSDVFDVIWVTKVIIESVNGNPCRLQELSLLHDKLKKMLEGKKFLFVFDDVWTEKYEDWIALSTPFRAGAEGSKIIITTRSEKVSSVTKTVSPHHLQLLSEEECYLLFKQHAFPNKKLNAHLTLERIGKEIVRKCKGLPLAAKAVGGVLRSKKGEGEWEEILNSKIWDVLDKESELGPALWLSYYHLPAHLKRCFVYCGIFPKDYEFDKEELVRLWMAEGFVGQMENLSIKKRMEDIGEGYFYDLFSRSFFQKSTKYSRFVMHDLINDLARVASGEMCFTMDDEEQREKQISENTRHLSYWRHEFERTERFEAFCGANKLRTLLSFGQPLCCYLPCQVPNDLMSRLVRLHVLCLRYYRNLVELPESIGNLVHLRYLDLSDTDIQRLPESINTLYNLQTLLLTSCKNLEKFPSDMGSLINLRYLEISGCYKLRKMCRGIGRLKELQILPHFIADENNGPGVDELTELEHLRGELEISGLENVKDPIQKKINLMNKRNLHTLKFRWDDSRLVVNEAQVKSVAELVLNHLQPHTNIKKLIVEGYCGPRFPSWLREPSCYSNLVTLHLLKCKNCKSIPPLGQLPSLEEIYISEMHGLKKVGCEFYGNGSDKPFRSLLYLEFSKMVEWEEWTGVGQGEQQFPRLQHLKMLDCPKLKTISLCFPKLVKLDIAHCGELSRLPSLAQLNNSPELTSFPRRLPSLNQLILNDCAYELLQNLVSCTPLTSLHIHGISRLTCLPHEEAFLQCLTTLQTLQIRNCQDLTSLWSCNTVVGGGIQHHYLTSLRYLSITSCHELEKLPDGLQNLTSLNELIISDCPGIESFPKEMELPSMLKCILIINCKYLKSFPEEFFMHTSLGRLEIGGCFSLNSFSRRDSGCSSSTTAFNITKLKEISIWECDSLESLPEGLHNLTSLESLHISGCAGITSMPDGGFPIPKLRCISIHNCQRLISLPHQLQYLKCLEVLRIIECPHLLSFPEGGLSSTKLRCLQIIGCEDLKCLPNQMNLLTSLEILMIHGCPSILSFPEGSLPSTSLRHLDINNCKNLKSFPDGFFPSSLRSISISIDCYSFLPLTAWQLQFCRFPPLKVLRLLGCSGIESFHEGLLPSTLTSLGISKFPDLKSLSEGLKYLTSLEALYVSCCPKLASLPDQGLPVTLRQLHIHHCPLLEKRCEKKKGEDWPKLSRISFVWID